MISTYKKRACAELQLQYNFKKVVELRLELCSFKILLLNGLVAKAHSNCHKTKTYLKIEAPDELSNDKFRTVLVKLIKMHEVLRGLNQLSSFSI